MCSYEGILFKLVTSTFSSESIPESLLIMSCEKMGETNCSSGNNSQKCGAIVFVVL